MGIDWYPFKPRRIEDLHQIRELATKQSRAFQACPRYWFFDGPSSGLGENNDVDEDESLACEEYRESSRSLEAIHDPWIDEFLEWVVRWSTRGYGLLLDY